MPKARLADLFDSSSPHAVGARRQVVAQACAGQDPVAIARLEGVTVEQAPVILQHPMLAPLVLFWSRLLKQVRGGVPVPAIEGMGQRSSPLELETGNHWMVNLCARFLVLVGDPGKGLISWAVARFERLVARNMIRQRRPSGPRPVRDAVGPDLEERFLREERREMLAAARYLGLHGGLDPRRLSHDWSRASRRAKAALLTSARRWMRSASL